MMATFAIGVLSWTAAFVWRVNTNWVNHHISATIVYVFQLLFVHTCFTVIPVVKSIRFQQLQKRGQRDTQQMHDDSFLANVGSNRLAAAQTSKQSFLVALQNTNEHQKLERFAKACMCAELMSFLDIYLAFKSCIYHNLSREPNA
ncbi:hypothetical protein IW147_001715 [Coemansia sp. RSA 720]|nr:hypothetical protein IW147_001715 [Coemansia sp. RSA 720]